MPIPIALWDNKTMSSIVDITRLSAAERLALIEEIWDSLELDDIPLTDAQREELDRRLDDLEKDPSRGIPWEDVIQRIRNRRR